MAAALPAEDRPAYLDRTCGADEEMRAEIECRLRELDSSDFMGVPAARISSPPPNANATLPASDQPGDWIVNYKLLEQIGEGGFGVVWVAEQEKPLRRRVALKIIKPGMDTKEIIARFEQERQALALMEHPNIARVLDAGATSYGRPYFVMELVPGIKITEFCDQSRLSTEERARLFADVCHAVQHAHQKGVIHRDLKPSNILVTLHDGVPVPKVIDFGVAKAIHEGQRLGDLTVYTKFQQMIGTPLYMSPEQAEMSGLDVDTRSDIYSLGAVLYELLTGRTPFDPEDLHRKGFDEIREAIREREPPRPSTYLSTLAIERRIAVAELRRSEGAKLIGLIRGDLDWIVMKALEKDRSRRYATANGLAEDLHRYSRNEPVLAGPPSGVYRFRRFIRRNRFACLAVSAIAVAILAVVAVLAVSTARITHERDQKDAALREKGAALRQSQASEQKAKEDLFLALLNTARAERFSRQMGERDGSLEALAEAARIHPDDRLRDEAIAAMALPDVRLGAKWSLEAGEMFDPTGRISAAAGSDGTIVLRTVPDRREIRRLQGLPKTVSMTFSHDGGYLAQQDVSGRLRISRISDGSALLEFGSQQSVAFAFSLDEQQVAVGLNQSVHCYDLLTQKERIRWITGAPVVSLDFNRDTRWLAVGYKKSKIVSIYDTETGTVLADLPMGSVTGNAVAWHPDGIHLAIGGDDPRIQIWDIQARERVATLEGNVQPVTIVRYHPGGEMLASVGWEGVLRLWEPSSGRLTLQLPRRVTSISFSNDGRLLGAVGQGESGHLLEVTPGQEYRTFVSSLGANQGGYHDCAMSPDGLFAIGMDDGVRFWDLTTGKEVAFQPFNIAYSLSFQRGGRELLVCGIGGLARFPIDRSGAAPGSVTVGQAKPITLPFAPMRISSDRAGRALAVCGEAVGSVILDLATEEVLTPAMDHKSAGYVAMSADGRWVASSGWHSQVVRLWNAKTGSMFKEWEFSEYEWQVFFSPDSRILVISGSYEFVFWDLESSREIRRVPREIAQYPSPVGFSPDGKLMALEMTPGEIHLQETATGRTIAKLSDPFGDIPTSIAFTPDSTKLVTVSPYGRDLHVWDLGKIRARLKTMNLDWDWPEFPTAGGSEKSN